MQSLIYFMSTVLVLSDACEGVLSETCKVRQGRHVFVHKCYCDPASACCSSSTLANVADFLKIVLAECYRETISAYHLSRPFSLTASLFRYPQALDCFKYFYRYGYCAATHRDHSARLLGGPSSDPRSRLFGVSDGRLGDCASLLMLTWRS